jgi:hypothetical protein
MTMTPEQHRAQAEASLDQMRSLSAGSPAFHGLAQSAIAHVLAAVAAYLEPPPAPQLPGLPPGWEIETRQNRDGEHRWGYVLSGPGWPAFTSRFLWLRPEDALGAGIRRARDESQAAGDVLTALTASEPDTGQESSGRPENAGLPDWAHTDGQPQRPPEARTQQERRGL